MSALLLETTGLYTYASEVSQIEVPTGDVHPLSRSTSRERLLSAQSLLDCILDEGAEVYECMYDMTRCRLLLPPLAFKDDVGRLFLIDGVHRVFAAHRRGILHIRLLLLEPPREPCGSLACWDDVAIRRQRSIPKEDLFVDFSRSKFIPTRSLGAITSQAVAERVASELGYSKLRILR